MKTSPLMPGLLLGVTSDTWPCQKLNDVRVSAPSCILYFFILLLKRWKTQSLNTKFCINKTSLSLTYYGAIISFKTYICLCTFIFGIILFIVQYRQIITSLFNCFSNVFIKHVIKVKHFYKFIFYISILLVSYWVNLV